LLSSGSRNLVEDIESLDDEDIEMVEVEVEAPEEDAEHEMGKRD